MIFIDMILSVVGVGYLQLVMFFWLPGYHLLHGPRNRDTRKEDQNLFVPKDLQLFFACLVKKLEIPPISEVSTISFPPRLSPRRRSVSSFLMLFSSWSLKDGLHQHESSWLSSSWNRSRRVSFLFPHWKRSSFENQDFWAKFFRRWEVWRDVFGLFLELFWWSLAVKISR